MRSCIAVACIVTVVAWVGLPLSSAAEPGSETKPRKHEVVRLSHTFQDKAKKNEFMQQCFNVFGKQEGVLLAGLGIRYTWYIGSTIIMIEDNTNNRGIPWIQMWIRKQSDQPTPEREK